MIVSEKRKESNKIIFLILNYETYWETKKCVESIYDTIGVNNIQSQRHEIVIVDNGSQNDSIVKLTQEYGECEGIHILETGDNLGFAKGNNYGFVYAKHNLGPDYIVMINSDIILTDKEFVDKIDSYYKKLNFAVAGPNVSLNNGQILNPVRVSLTDTEKVRKRIKQVEKQIKLCKLGIEPFCAGFNRFVKLFPRDSRKCNDGIIDELDKRYQLHGCFLIFSKQYIDKFDGLYDRTFLYGEETLLRMRCDRENLKMCFLKDISAIHNESKTEKYIGNSINQRHLKRYTNTLEALNVIYEYMKSGDI